MTHETPTGVLPELLTARQHLVMQALNKPPFPRPEAWQEEETTITDKINGVLTDFILSASSSVQLLAQHPKIERQVISQTRGREGEDEELALDLDAHTVEKYILEKLALKHGVSLFIFAEHGGFSVGANPDKPDGVICIDETENSGEFKAGLNTPLYVTAGSFDPEGNPTGSTIANLQTLDITINRGGKNFVYNPITKLYQELLQPEKILTIKDKRFLPVSYDGKYKYTHPFHENFDALDRERNQDQVLHGKAGSHLGEPIATGAISAYIMFGEPIAEVLQYLAIARDAGYTVADVNPEDGSYEEYKFDAGFYLENSERYSTDRIKFLVIANSKPLLREIIAYGMTKPFPGWNGVGYNLQKLPKLT